MVVKPPLSGILGSMGTVGDARGKASPNRSCWPAFRSTLRPPALCHPNLTHASHLRIFEGLYKPRRRPFRLALPLPSHYSQRHYTYISGDDMISKISTVWETGGVPDKSGEWRG